jgi:hypothetical protein
MTSKKFLRVVGKETCAELPLGGPFASDAIAIGFRIMSIAGGCTVVVVSTLFVVLQVVVIGFG